MHSVYLDYNSTALIDPQVVVDMDEALRAGFANPASQHGPGRRARQALAAARREIGALLGLPTESPAGRLVLTSGGTEANNLALFGFCQRPPGSIVVSPIEHSSVARCITVLQSRGFEIRKLPVDRNGLVAVDRLAELIDDGTQLVCLMLANNETGVIQPVPQAAEVCRRLGVPLHCDAVQAIGKMPVDFGSLGVTSLSLGAHKFNGPRGIGALLIDGDAELTPLLHGGSQQFALRPGTEDVVLAVGMLAALRGWSEHGEARRTEMKRRRIGFERRLLERVPDAMVIGRDVPRLPQTCQIAFPGVNRQALFMAADLQGVFLSTGSACASGSSEPSATLRAMQIPDSLVDSAVRISFGFQTGDDELNWAADRLAAIVENLRKTRP
jgi:cysteine desulfurase